MTFTVLAMPRSATGSIETHTHADARTVTYGLRVRFGGRKVRVKLGTNHEGWGPERAQVELDRVNQQIARGTWEAPKKNQTPTDPVASEVETFRVFMSRWWQRKKPELSDKGREDYEWRLNHLHSFFKDMPVTEIGVRQVDEYIAARLAEREDPKLLPDGRRPLSNRSINMTLVLLAQILEDAVEYGMIEVNPASGRRRRLKQERPSRGFLEPDMVVDLLDTAGAWERSLPSHQRFGRRALLALLCLGGPRISEALTYRRGQLDLHAGVLRGGNKTAAGRDRTIDLSWMLLDELRAHISREPPAPADALLFHTRSGRALSDDNVRRMLRQAIDKTNERRASAGRLLLPEPTTPHTLRRTFASLCFFAGRDARFVMAQLGHADAKLTLEVYAKCMERRRIDRDLVWGLMRFADEPETMPGRGAAREPTAPAEDLKEVDA